MKKEITGKILLILIGTFISCSSLFSQVVTSERASIRIDITNESIPTIELSRPIIVSGKTSIFEEPELKIFGKLLNSKGNERILVNNNPADLTPDKYFYTDITLIPGYNTLKIVILSDGNPVNEFSYPLYFAIKQKNLSIPLLTAGKYFALIMGVNRYSNASLRDLERPISDAKSIYDVLTTKYNFDKENTILLPDPTRSDIITALDNLQAKLTVNDNLLIFYAGHGTFDKDAKIGFWLPADASRDSRANWLSNSNLTDYLKLIRTKHTLVISDACFSGSIFISRGAFEGIPKPIEKAYELPSKQALTSGSLYEVPDNSVFIYYLLDRLNKNNDHYLSAEQLYINIKTAIHNNSDDNTQFGEIQGVGHEGGDFIFILKKQ